MTHSLVEMESLAMMVLAEPNSVMEASRPGEFFIARYQLVGLLEVLWLLGVIIVIDFRDLN